MPLIRGASALVIRCFRRVEVVADVLTGAAGPVFIVLAWVLTGLAGTVFFDVVARDLPLLPTLLLLPAYILVPLNLYGQYWLVTHVSPGHPRPQNAKQAAYTHPDPRSLLAPERWGWERERVPSPLLGARRRVRRCRKCDGPKPERSHHCKVCKRCVLLMDHHCPWINGCVGLHNQRHFVLFMAWLSIGCWFVLALGYGHFWRSLDFRADWPAYSPKVAFTLSYILAAAIGIAVPVLDGWHMYMVARGETSIEGHDNDYLEKRAKKSGLVYLNPYDMGRRRNLEIFFNIGPGGYPATTLLFPLVVPPYSNGWSWPRRAMPTTLPPKPPQPAQPGYEAERGDGPGGVYLMGNGDEMTDDEEGDAGFWEPQGVERREE